MMRAVPPTPPRQMLIVIILFAAAAAAATAPARCDGGQAVTSRLLRHGGAPARRPDRRQPSCAAEPDVAGLEVHSVEVVDVEIGRTGQVLTTAVGRSASVWSVLCAADE